MYICLALLITNRLKLNTQFVYKVVGLVLYIYQQKISVLCKHFQPPHVSCKLSEHTRES